MVPKIEFVYSRVYDSMWPKPKEKLSKKEANRYLKSVEKLWKKESNKILKEISKLSGLKWKEKKIKVYFLSGGRNFSNPLTLTHFKDKKQFIDNLTHELIHQIQIQNRKKYFKWDKEIISKKYSNEPFSTKAHIFLHAAHYKILEKFYGKRRINKNIKFHDKYKDYMRAWEIVKEETPDKIIKEFRMVTK